MKRPYKKMIDLNPGLHSMDVFLMLLFKKLEVLLGRNLTKSYPFFWFQQVEDLKDMPQLVFWTWWSHSSPNTKRTRHSFKAFPWSWAWIELKLLLEEVVLAKKKTRRCTRSATRRRSRTTSSEEVPCGQNLIQTLDILLRAWLSFTPTVFHFLRTNRFLFLLIIGLGLMGLVNTYPKVRLELTLDWRQSPMFPTRDSYRLSFPIPCFMFRFGIFH